MFTSFFLMRCSSRSSGPSKFCRLDRIARRATIRSRAAGVHVTSVPYELHRVAHALHRLRRRPRAPASSLRAGSRAACPGLASTAARRSRIGSRCAFSAVGQLRLHLDVADLAGAVARLQIVDFRRVRVERVVVDEHRIAFDRARECRRGRASGSVYICTHLLLHRLGVVRQVNRVAEALAHLLVAVEPGQARERRQQRLRLDEHARRRNC